MKRTLIAAALAVLPLCAFGAILPLANDLPAHLRIAHGQSIQQAIQLARFHAQIDRLIAAHTGPAAAGTDAKTTQPTIIGGAVLSATLTVGQAGSNPVVKLAYKTGPSGLAGVTLVFSAPNGAQSLSVTYSPFGLVTHDHVTFEQPGTPPPYSQPGQWQMTAAYMADYAGNYVSYTQAQLAALFPAPYITVVNNGPVDITPPKVRAGQILTPTVSLSSPVPAFAATLRGRDDVSGLYAPYVGVEAPGGSYSQVDNALMPFPLRSGTGTAYSTLFASQPTGTWAITFYAFCDVAGNCFSDADATDIQTLFGATSFQVTN